MKNYKWIYAILAIVLVPTLIGLTFYWYEWRPSSIRKECYTISTEQAVDLLKTKAELSGGDRFKEGAAKGLYLSDDQKEAYSECLNKNGLVK